MGLEQKTPDQISSAERPALTGKGTEAGIREETEGSERGGRSWGGRVKRVFKLFYFGEGGRPSKEEEDRGEGGERDYLHQTTHLQQS